MTLPVDFEAKLKAPPSATGGGYPAQISAGDLMRNFVYAALDAEPGLITESNGVRKLKIPAAPASGTHVLGSVDGELQWIATEAC